MRVTLDGGRRRPPADALHVVVARKGPKGSAVEGGPDPAALRRALVVAGFDAARGAIWLGQIAGARVLVVGCGPASDPAAALREAAMRAAREASRVRAGVLDVTIPAWPGVEVPDLVRATAEGLHAGAYRFDRYATVKKGNGAPETAVLRTRPVGSAERRALARAAAAARAVSLARDLVNEPASSLTPSAFAARAVKEAREAGLRARVLDAPALSRLRAGALLAVARGSAEPPQVVHLVYRPRRRTESRVVLVGKGVTFDSGGLNLKPGAGMLSMKSDMAGAAAVLATMTALGAAGCRHEVHGLLGLVENMTGSRAFKPGDILRSMAGRTIEVTNTDAEGRLVLCDLITHAGRKLSPDRIVDVATLTGHVVIALGVLASGLFTNDDALGEELRDAAAAAGEKLWRLPLYDEYLDDLRDGPADLKNSGERWGGAISAALFLREFVPAGTPWAHLDIAGPAFLETPRAGWPAGATGAAVPTLLRWLEG